MLRITKSNIKADHLRDYKGYFKYGLKLGRFNKILQIYNAYSSNMPLTYFYARLLDLDYNIIGTFELATNLISHSNGQYYISGVYYDDVNNGLIDGLWFLEFSNGTEIFKSEVFRVDEKAITGVAMVTSTIKQYEDDPIFEYNDSEI